jgi:two-component system phosphate regulon response regulator PhoB
MARLLLIDADAAAPSLSDHLATMGHEVTTVTSGREGLRVVARERPELVLIDYQLPDMSGTEVCRAIRADRSTRSLPIVLLSSRDDEIDRVVGFEVGADDVVIKPPLVRELALRVRAILRRLHHGPSVTAGGASIGELKLDVEAHRVMVAGEEAPLSALEFKLLTTLYESRGRVRTRSSLLDAVWGDNDAVSTRTVDACVKRLRQKLGRAGNLIETVRGVGYRFTAAPTS